MERADYCLKERMIYEESVSAEGGFDCEVADLGLLLSLRGPHHALGPSRAETPSNLHHSCALRAQENGQGFLDKDGNDMKERSCNLRSLNLLSQ